MADKTPHNMESASDRAHGTMGKGDVRETKLDDQTTRAGNDGEPEAHGRSAASSDEMTAKLSDAGWGSGASGGSVVDKRGPTPRKGDDGASEG
jgi:hypothetical protein